MKNEIIAPNIFNYTNYREFLAHFVKFKLDTTNLSYRALAKKAGINSPNYFQMIINGTRNLTAASALKISNGILLKGSDRKYFLKLVELEHAKKTEDKIKVMEQLKTLSLKNQKIKILDNSLETSWLNYVLWELATTKNFQMIPEKIAEKLPNISAKEIDTSLKFLIDKGYLVSLNSSAYYQQANVIFEVPNDIKNLNVQTNHMQFLELAKKNLNAPVDQREYQGLTIAVSESKIPLIKNRIRNFLQELSDELANDSEAENVMHIQCCAFKITSDKQSLI